MFPLKLLLGTLVCSLLTKRHHSYSINFPKFIKPENSNKMETGANFLSLLTLASQSHSGVDERKSFNLTGLASGSNMKHSHITKDFVRGSTICFPGV